MFLVCLTYTNILSTSLSDLIPPRVVSNRGSRHFRRRSGSIRG